MAIKKAQKLPKDWYPNIVKFTLPEGVSGGHGNSGLENEYIMIKGKL